MGKIISSLFARGAMRAWQVFVFLLVIQIPCHHCPKGLIERMRAHASECEKLQELKLWSPNEDPKAKRQKQTVLSFGTTNVKVSMGFIFVLVCLGFFLGRPVGASVGKFVFATNSPFSIVENKEFLSMMQLIRPDIRVPSTHIEPCLQGFADG